MFCEKCYCFCVTNLVFFVCGCVFLLVFALSCDSLDGGKLPEQTTLNGTFNILPDQTKRIVVERSYLSGGFEDMDKAYWSANLTIWGESNTNLEKLDIKNNCYWKNTESYIDDNTLVVLYLVRDKKNCLIIIHNTGNATNNITYRCDLFSQGNYGSWRYNNIGAIYAQQFVIWVTAALLVISLSMPIIDNILDCIMDQRNNLVSKMSLKDGPDYQFQKNSDEEL